MVYWIDRFHVTSHNFRSPYCVLFRRVLFLRNFEVVLDTQENEVKSSENMRILAGVPGVAREWKFLKILPLAPVACPRSPRGHAAGKKNLSWCQKYPHAKFQNDWSCSFRDLTLAPAARPRLPSSRTAGKKNLSWSQRYPHAKFQNDWSCSFRDLPLAPAARPRLPRMP